MSDVKMAKARPGRRTAAEYRAELNEIFAEFDRVQERIEARQRASEGHEAEMERLRRETREILVSLGVKL